VASGAGAVVHASAVPVIEGVRELIGAGMIAGGTQRNHAFVAEDVDFGDLALSEQLLLADAQTSGGLLLSVPPDRADRLLEECRTRGTLASAVIGEVTGSRPGPRITVKS
jgi:selenide,water dikinase